MKRTRDYYRERAAYMRKLAEEAETEALRASCLRAAEQFDGFAAALPDAKDQRKTG